MAIETDSVWRLTILWRGTVMDSVLVAGPGHHNVPLRTGDTLRVRISKNDGDDDDDDDETQYLVVEGPGLNATLAPGQRVCSADGTEVFAHPDHRGPAVSRPLTIDTTLLHAGMVAVAVITVLASALWFHPVVRPGDPGAGIPADARRWLSVSGGTAPRVGRPALNIAGRPLDLAERFVLRQREGRTARREPTPAPSVDRAIEAMKQALHGGNVGNDGSDRDAIGALARQVAAAPVLGAGVGGLSPRDPVEHGAGSGALGAGETLTVNVQRFKPRADVDDTALPPRPVYPVKMVDVPDADVDGSEAVRSRPTLDPLVMDHLTRAVRGRHNVVRACYEAWGLAANAQSEGRLVLELTLLPDGHVTNLSTTTTAPLSAVGHCIERAASEWYLGGGLVDVPARLAFPFNLRPRTR